MSKLSLAHILYDIAAGNALTQRALLNREQFAPRNTFSDPTINLAKMTRDRTGSVDSLFDCRAGGNDG